MAESVVGNIQDKFDIHTLPETTDKQTDKLLHDGTHPLKTDLDNTINGRLFSPMIKTTRYAGSSVPSAIKGFNMRIGRTRTYI